MKRLTEQSGYAKLVAVLALCLVVAGCYYLFSYRPSHSAKTVAHKAAVAKQIAKIDKGKQLQTKLQAALQQVVTVTPPDGNVDLAVYDSTTGATVHFTFGTGPFITASVMKLSLLETMLWHNQQHGISSLTSSQLAQATPMIENSDNDSATDVYLADGGSSGLNTFLKRIGATSTTAGDHWGLTPTTALDQLKVVNEVAYPGKLLTAGSASQANNLMDHVEANQQWGVSGGVPAGVTVRLKNGWLPNSDIDGTSGWNVNSIGHVHGQGVDYTIAVLTNEDRTEQSGINTIEALSTAIWNTISAAK